MKYRYHIIQYTYLQPYPKIFSRLDYIILGHSRHINMFNLIRLVILTEERKLYGIKLIRYFTLLDLLSKSKKNVMRVWMVGPVMLVKIHNCQRCGKPSEQFTLCCWDEDAGRFCLSLLDSFVYKSGTISFPPNRE